MTDSKPDTENEAPAPPRERVDDDGLPLDRKPTMDDVRGTEGSGRTIAIGCTVLVAGLGIAFWLLRVYLLG